MVIDTKEVIPTCIAFAPIDDIILVVGLSSGNLRLYDSKGNQNFDLVAHESAVSCLEWNYQYDKTNIEVFKKNLQKISIYPQKLMLATGSSDTTVKIWEMLKGIRYELKLVIALKTHVK
jgi:WD40 repeat protein